jgi:hypothetical protein
VGLILCPFAYIATGALSGFPAGFSYTSLPPLLLGSGFLLGRYLARPKESAAGGILLGALEAISWLVLVTFLYLVSGVNLSIGIERFGLACTGFLAASLVALPVLLLRPTRLETRLARLPRGLATLALIVIVAGATFAMIVNLITPPTPIGGDAQVSSGVCWRASDAAGLRL